MKQTTAKYRAIYRPDGSRVMGLDEGGEPIDYETSTTYYPDDFSEVTEFSSVELMKEKISTFKISKTVIKDLR